MPAVTRSGAARDTPLPGWGLVARRGRSSCGRSSAGRQHLRARVRLLVIVYALLPLVFLAIFSSSRSLSTPGLAYSLYIAPLWAISLWLLLCPGKLAAVEIGIGIIVWVTAWLNLITVNIDDHLVNGLRNGTRGGAGSSSCLAGPFRCCSSSATRCRRRPLSGKSAGLPCSGVTPYSWTWSGRTTRAAPDREKTSARRRTRSFITGTVAIPAPLVPFHSPVKRGTRRSPNAANPSRASVVAIRW
jgi:hypothetical protein